MDVDSAINAYSKEQLQMEETDNSCRLDFLKNPVARDTDSSCTTTECVGGDCPTEAKQENLSVVKQEPDDVWYII